MDRGAWQTTVHGILNSQTRLSDSAQHGTVPHCICVCLCVCVCVCITFFIHLSVDGHSGGFHIFGQSFFFKTEKKIIFWPCHSWHVGS